MASLGLPTDALDELTGLATRRYLTLRFEEECARARRHGRPLSVLIADIDFFKGVNDRYGHARGDAVLAAIGEALLQAARTEDVCVRYGGDEFVVLLPETDAVAALAVAQRLHAAVALLRVPMTDEAVWRPTLSIGVATAPEHGWEPAALLDAADQALLVVKRHGRNGVAVAGADDAPVSPSPEPAASVGPVLEGLHPVCTILGPPLDERLRTLVATATHTTPRVVLLTGEAGAGKSVRTRALMQHAPEGHFAVRVACLPSEAGEAAPSYAPWIACFAAIAAGRLAPPVNWHQLWRALPGTDVGVDGLSPAAGALLHAEAMTFLSAAGQIRPILLVMEDVQWADPGTRALLDHVIGTLNDAPRARLTVVCTGRPSELHDATLLRAFARPAVIELRIPPLADEDVGQMAAALLGGVAPPPLLLGRLLELGAGNPLAIQHLVHGALAAGEVTLTPGGAVDLGRATLGVPRGVLDSSRRRLERAPRAVQALVAVMADADRAWSIADVCRRLGVDETAAREECHQACEAGVLWRSGHLGADDECYTVTLPAAAFVVPVTCPVRDAVTTRAATIEQLISAARVSACLGAAAASAHAASLRLAADTISGLVSAGRVLEASRLAWWMARAGWPVSPTAVIALDHARRPPVVPRLIVAGADSGHADDTSPAAMESCGLALLATTDHHQGTRLVQRAAMGYAQAGRYAASARVLGLLNTLAGAGADTRPAPPVREALVLAMDLMRRAGDGHQPTDGEMQPDLFGAVPVDAGSGLRDRLLVLLAEIIARDAPPPSRPAA